METESTPKKKNKKNLTFGKDGPQIDASKLLPETQAALERSPTKTNFREEVSRVRKRGSRASTSKAGDWLATKGDSDIESYSAVQEGTTKSKATKRKQGESDSHEPEDEASEQGKKKSKKSKKSKK